MLGWHFSGDSSKRLQKTRCTDYWVGEFSSSRQQRCTLVLHRLKMWLHRQVVGAGNISELDLLSNQHGKTFHCFYRSKIVHRNAWSNGVAIVSTQRYFTTHELLSSAIKCFSRGFFQCIIVRVKSKDRGMSMFIIVRLALFL